MVSLVAGKVRLVSTAADPHPARGAFVRRLHGCRRLDTELVLLTTPFSDVRLLVTRLGPAERLLAEAIERRGIRPNVVELDGARFTTHEPPRAGGAPLWLSRIGSSSAALIAVRHLEASGARCVNSAAVISACADRHALAAALAHHDVAVPMAATVFSTDAALAAAEELGYPLELSVCTGSWERWTASVPDGDAVRSLLSRDATSAAGVNHVVHLQRPLSGEGRQLRLVIVGTEAIAGFPLSAVDGPWLLDGDPTDGGLDDEPVALGRRAASVIGSGMYSIDLLHEGDAWLVDRVSPHADLEGAPAALRERIAERCVTFALDGAGR